jgi:hypothetical protein
MLGLQMGIVLIFLANLGQFTGTDFLHLVPTGNKPDFAKLPQERSTLRPCTGLNLAT